MQRLRSILLLLFMLLLTPPFACACFLAFPFMSTAARFRMVRVWTRWVVEAARWLCGIDYRYLGCDHVEAALDKQVVVMSKHQSAWETIAFVAHSPRDLCFVFKRELLFVPFFGWALGMLRMVHINRKEGASAFTSIVNQGRRRLADGAWMIFFPEGTRTRTGTQGRYKAGGARLAVQTGAWVLPVAHNAGRCWPRNSLLKHRGMITVSVGPAISSEGKTPEALLKEVEQWIEAEMRRIDPDAYN